jgi:hypothetical protein
MCEPEQKLKHSKKNKSEPEYEIKYEIRKEWRSRLKPLYFVKPPEDFKET